MLGHVEVNTMYMTNVEDNSILHKPSIPIVSYVRKIRMALEYPVYVGCYLNVDNSLTPTCSSATACSNHWAFKTTTLLLQ